jgi:hypothetical protein
MSRDSCKKKKKIGNDKLYGKKGYIYRLFFFFFFLKKKKFK